MQHAETGLSLNLSGLYSRLKTKAEFGINTTFYISSLGYQATDDKILLWAVELAALTLRSSSLSGFTCKTNDVWSRTFSLHIQSNSEKLWNLKASIFSIGNTIFFKNI